MKFLVFLLFFTPLFSQAKSSFDFDNISIFVQFGMITDSNTDVFSSPGIDSNYFNYNYSLGVGVEKDRFLIGAVYNVKTLMAWGNMENQVTQTTDSYEFQANDFLLGLTLHYFILEEEKSRIYLRGDAGVSWVNDGEGAIVSPFLETLANGAGFNVGIGLLVNAGFGEVDLSLLRHIRMYEEGDFSNTSLNLGLRF